MTDITLTFALGWAMTIIASLLILAVILWPRQAYKPTRRPRTSANHPLDWECPVCHSPVGHICREAGEPVAEGYCHIDRQQLVSWRN